jgi:4-azaleucine resistance transporter AzlC
LVRFLESRTILEGSKAAWPVCLGYVPIGLAFGVLAQKNGLEPLAIGLMSLLVFAGSSQFIAVSMLASQAGAPAIIATTFMVNLRHLLMSSALAVFCKGQAGTKLTLFAYGVTDESFAINYNYFRSGAWNLDRALVVNHTTNLAWIASTVAGGYAGQVIPAGALGIDYVLIAMFMALLAMQLKGAVHWLTAGFAGATAVGLALVLPGNVHVVLASAGAAALGAILRKRCARGGRT